MENPGLQSGVQRKLGHVAGRPCLNAGHGFGWGRASARQRWKRWRQEKRQEARALLRRSRRKETKSPAAAFIEGGHHGHTTRAEVQGEKRATVAQFTPGEKFEAPTPSNSHARCTRTLISQAKRPIRSGHNSTAVSIPHAPRLKRSALKSYVRALPSKGAALDPPLTKRRTAVSVGRGFRLTRPHDDPERKIARRFLLGADSVSPDPDAANKSRKPFQGQKSPGHGHLRSRGCED